MAGQAANAGSEAKMAPTLTDTLANSVHGTRIRTLRRSVNAPQADGPRAGGCGACDFGSERQLGDDVTGRTDLWKAVVQTYSGLCPPQTV